MAVLADTYSAAGKAAASKGDTDRGQSLLYTYFNIIIIIIIIIIYNIDYNYLSYSYHHLPPLTTTLITRVTPCQPTSQLDTHTHMTRLLRAT
jgi:hypothetical protein